MSLGELLKEELDPITLTIMLVVFIAFIIIFELFLSLLEKV